MSPPDVDDFKKMLTVVDRYEAALAANPLRTQMLCTGVLFGAPRSPRAHAPPSSRALRLCIEPRSKPSSSANTHRLLFFFVPSGVGDIVCQLITIAKAKRSHDRSAERFSLLRTVRMTVHGMVVRTQQLTSNPHVVIISFASHMNQW